MNSLLANKLTSKLATKVDIFVSCRNLLDMDVFSKSDPMCVMSELINRKWIELGRTECIQNDLNPQFSISFKVEFYFEQIQKVRFTVHDIDNLTTHVDNHDYLGSAETTIGEIVSNSPLILPLYLKTNTHAGEGKIILRAVEESGTKDQMLKMKMSGSRLDKKDFFGKSDPYLEFSKVMSDGGTQVTHRTEHIENTLDPVWREFEVAASRLCDGGAEDVIKVSCYDSNMFSLPSLIGSFCTTLQQLTQQQPVQWELVNPKKKAKKASYKNSGTISLDLCEATTIFSFLDFVFGGLQLKFCVSIDFTASNGDPRNSDSLHYLDHRTPNHYVRAIRSVGQVIKDYDSTQQFPVTGFGARIPSTHMPSHCFNLHTFTQQLSYAHGIQGILDSYHHSLLSIQLYGPTNFAPTIQHFSQLARQASLDTESFMYHVLLIITDGVITDMTHTIQAIITASSLPLSIIIVGVGRADFEMMDRLDSDDRLLRDEVSGRVAKRDIVQFVPFRDYEGASEEELGKQVLAELPAQVVSYYRTVGIVPAEPKTLDEQKFNPPSENVLPQATFHQPPSSTPYPPPSFIQPPPTSSNQYPPPSSTPYPPPPSSLPGQNPTPYPPPPSSLPGQYPTPYPPQQLSTLQPQASIPHSLPNYHPSTIHPPSNPPPYAP